MQNNFQLDKLNQYQNGEQLNYITLILYNYFSYNY